LKFIEFVIREWEIHLITIANPGLGNFVSISNMYKFLEIDVEIISDPRKLTGITHLILPGVGAFDSGMSLLSKTGWKSAIMDLSPEVNILGICLGMQLLTNGSEEGSLPGLGLIEGQCRRFPESGLSIPHIGWNNVSSFSESELFHAEEINRFYFSHSYYVETRHEFLSTGLTDYGLEFTSSFKFRNIYGVQFHPEKSHKYGMRLLRRFAEI
jgi:glutamine amidotransferase